MRNKADDAFRRLVLKIEVLSYYGKGGHLQCCWKGCPVTQPDMLTLDHVLDDGNKNRYVVCNRRRGGDALYRYLKRHNFPKGCQTLCSNHQGVKENRRRRSKLEEKKKIKK